ncbi:P-II family nitrogen regulator [Methanocaldococcus sp.]
MKKIKAIIRLEKYLDVRKALFEKGYEDIIVKKVKGRGLQWGVLGRYRAREKN